MWMAPLALALTFPSAGCSDASGQLVGGALVYDAATVDSAGGGGGGGVIGPCPNDGGMTRWQDLYACYFHSCGTGGGLGCHNSISDEGATFSGFVCGTSAATCFTGLTTSSNGSAPIVAPGGAADATSTPLWAALNKAGVVSTGLDNNMPLQSPATPAYVFQAADLASIRAWIQGGAPNN